jgi:hypothetical protein
MMNDKVKILQIIPAEGWRYVEPIHGLDASQEFPRKIVATEVRRLIAWALVEVTYGNRGESEREVRGIGGTGAVIVSDSASLLEESDYLIFAEPGVGSVLSDSDRESVASVVEMRDNIEREEWRRRRETS